MYCSPSYISWLQDLLPFPYLQAKKPSIFFDPIVAELASWLTKLSVDSSLTVKDFVGQKSKLASLAQSGAVLFDADSCMVFIPTGALGGYSLETKYIICAAIQAFGETSVVEAENVVGAGRNSPLSRQFYAAITSALNYILRLRTFAQSDPPLLLDSPDGSGGVVGVFWFNLFVYRKDPCKGKGLINCVMQKIDAADLFRTSDDARSRAVREPLHCGRALLG